MTSILFQYLLNRRIKLNECILCGKPWSRRSRESPNPEVPICSKCNKWKAMIKIHNHYYSCQDTEPQFSRVYIARSGEQTSLNEPTELPNEFSSDAPHSQRGGSDRLPTIRAEPQLSKVYITRSGEQTSSSEPNELPNEFSSDTHPQTGRPGRLPTIREEPPSVNRRSKPKLRN
jgi:hypothetical protein